MNCEDLNDVLVDLVDGRLDGAEQRSVERHLEGCAQLPRARRGSAQHPRRGVHARSARAEGRDVVDGCRPRSPRSRRRAAACSTWPAPAAQRWRKLAGVAWRGGGADPRHGDRPAAADESRASRRTTTARRMPADAAAEVTVESVTAEFEAAEKHYQKAIDDLQTIANKDTGELDPQVAAVLQKNLTVIDQAITESRAALKVAAGEQQRAERPVRRAAHEGRAAAADRRADQRNAQGQSSRGGAPHPDAVAIAICRIRFFTFLARS